MILCRSRLVAARAGREAAEAVAQRELAEQLGAEDRLAQVGLAVRQLEAAKAAEAGGSLASTGLGIVRAEVAGRIGEAERQQQELIQR